MYEKIRCQRNIGEYLGFLSIQFLGSKFGTFKILSLISKLSASDKIATNLKPIFRNCYQQQFGNQQMQLWVLCEILKSVSHSLSVNSKKDLNWDIFR